MKNKVEIKTDKLTDKSFMQSIVVSVLGMLLCMLLLCGTTWAWFSEGVSSSQNTIAAADCTVTITVTANGTPVTPIGKKYEFTAGTEYLVTVKAVGSAKSAYCKLTSNDKEYFTQQFALNGPERGFTLKFTSNTTVTIEDRWGTYHKEEREIHFNGNYEDFVDTTSPTP